MKIEAHCFETEEAAKNAIAEINEGENIPRKVDSSTTSYTDCFADGDYWYIFADEVTKKYINDVVMYTPPEINN